MTDMNNNNTELEAAPFAEQNLYYNLFVFWLDCLPIIPEQYLSREDCVALNKASVCVLVCLFLHSYTRNLFFTLDHLKSMIDAIVFTATINLCIWSSEWLMVSLGLPEPTAFFGIWWPPLHREIRRTWRRPTRLLPTYVLIQLLYPLFLELSCAIIVTIFGLHPPDG